MTGIFPQPQQRNKPWPFSPAVIVDVEEYDDNGECVTSYCEVRVHGFKLFAPDYDSAVLMAYSAVAMITPANEPRVLGFGGHDQMGVT